MTLLGKIFTLLTIIMSLVFMSFAVAVYSTHKQWKELVLNDSPERLGLQQQLKQATEKNKELEAKRQEALTLLAREKAAQSGALAALESKFQQIKGELEAKDKVLGTLTTAVGEAERTLKTQEDNLETVTKAVDKTRDDIVVAMQQRDKYFNESTKVSGNLHEAQALLGRLQETNQVLSADLARYEDLARRNGVNVHRPEGTPQLDGVVMAVNDKDQIEVSLGVDDGLQVNHELVVFRENTYLGKVRVLRSDADRAVGQLIPGTKQGEIRKGDRVITKVG